MGQQKEGGLKIGEVVYILSNKNQNVIPALVVEESITKTLQGSSTVFKIQMGSGQKAKIVDSSKIDGEIFTNIDIVKETLSKRLNEYIDNLIATTKQRQEAWYGKRIITKTSKKEEVIGPLLNVIPAVKKELSKEELREELRKSIVANDDEVEILTEDNGETSMPNNIDDFIHHNPNS